MTVYRFTGIFVVFIAAALTSACSKKLEQENATLTQRLQELSDQKAITERELVTANANLQAQTQRTDDLMAREADLQKARDRLQSELQSLSSRLAVADASLAETKGALDALRAEFNAYREQQERAEEARLKAQLANQKGDLFGTVSYFFNENYGFKPDSGSEIWIWRSDQYPDFDANQLIDFLFGRIQLTKDAERALASTLMRIQYAKDTLKASADGNGAFQRKLSPGRYYVLVQSAHRKNLNLLEVTGKLSFHIVDIAPNEQANIDAKFHVY